MNNVIETLTWDDIEEWPVTAIAARGQEYFRRQQVKDIAIIDCDAILAWVDGNERYATQGGCHFIYPDLPPGYLVKL